MRSNVLDPLSREQLNQLSEITEALLTRLDPEQKMTALYDPAASARDAT